MLQTLRIVRDSKLVYFKRFISTASVMSKKVLKKVESQWENEGVGAKVMRSIGRSEFPELDPFLLLDEFKGKPPVGFPDHPHRGFETVTYLLTGAVKHEDFLGNKGIIQTGDVQWMTAGRGVLHSEMFHGDVESHGLQLWVNLCSEYKMIEPAWQELLAKDIPCASKDGVKVKVIAGESLGVCSPVYTRTPVLYVDVYLDPSACFKQPIKSGWTAFIYTLEGHATIGCEGHATEVGPHHTCILSTEEDNVCVQNKGNDLCHFALIAGQPLKEPIARRGPFVMNTQDELKQTFSDYENAKNGFEKKLTWRKK